MVLETSLFALAAYVVGSAPFGKLVAKGVARIDITQQGSKNIGATNVARELGLKWGLLTLILDMLKGFLPVFLYGYYASPGYAGNTMGLSVVALAPLLGHQFSLFMGFHGGKGVATAFGIYLAISPFSCLLALLLFLFMVYKWDFISLGSMVSALALPALLTLFGRQWPLVIGALFAAALICLSHRENIRRLASGEERKWSERKRQSNRSKSLSNSSSE
jgi:glycerol-3-phosphate acyltransferase PlsY